MLSAEITTKGTFDNEGGQSSGDTMSIDDMDIYQPDFNEPKDNEDVDLQALAQSSQYWQSLGKTEDVPDSTEDETFSFADFPLREGLLRGLAERLVPAAHLGTLPAGVPYSTRLLHDFDVRNDSCIIKTEERVNGGDNSRASRFIYQLPPPTQAQAAILSFGLSGRSVLAQAKSGTGKTIACTLVAFQRVHPGWRWSWTECRSFFISQGQQPYLGDVVKNQLPTSAAKLSDFGFPSVNAFVEKASSANDKIAVWLKDLQKLRKLALSSGWGGVQALQCIMVSPTREIVLQTFAEMTFLAKQIHQSVRIRVNRSVGGRKIEEDVRQLKSDRPHVLVVTPGRLLSLIGHESSLACKRKKKFLDSIWVPPPQETLKLLMMDEADRLFEEQFSRQAKDILGVFLSRQTQILMLSATFPPPVVARLERTVHVLDTERINKRPPEAARSRLIASGFLKDLVEQGTSTDAVNLLREAVAQNFLGVLEEGSEEMLATRKFSKGKSLVAWIKSDDTSGCRTLHRLFFCSSLMFHNGDGSAEAVLLRDRDIETKEEASSRLRKETGADFIGGSSTLALASPTLIGLDFYAYHIPMSYTGPLEERHNDQWWWNRVKRAKLRALVVVLLCVPFRQAILFANYSDWAQNLVNQLDCFGFPSIYTSAKMNQAHRERAIAQLRSGQIRLLVSSDVAARGLDLEQVDLVVHLDIPEDKETFLHRSGRAARFGGCGCVLAIVTRDERPFLEYLEFQTEITIRDFSCFSHPGAPNAERVTKELNASQMQLDDEDC